MKKGQFRYYDLDKHRPKVLLIGNGLTYDTSVSWSELIKKVSRDKVKVSYYEETETNGSHKRFLVPNTILTLVTSAIDDCERHQKYLSALNDESNKNGYPTNRKIEQLLNLPFDAVLTTNYTYEIESAIISRYPRLKASSKRKYAATTGKQPDNKFLLHTFNRLTPDSPDIWHIHGELRRPSSLILSHDEYARYIHQIILHNSDRGNDYVNYRNELKMKSWVDYFLVGDMYILGLGLDFSEFDLWWLLGRRLREKSGWGEFVFYEPKSVDNIIKQQALRDVGVKVENCNIDIDIDRRFDDFYYAAIEDINTRMNQ